MLECLKQLRTDFKLTQKEFADSFGLSETAISLYESGKRVPDVQTLLGFAKFFGVSLDYLCDNHPQDDEQGIIIPVVSLIGIMEGNVVEREYFGTRIAYGISSADEYRYFKVSDNNMYPEIKQGDVLLIHLQNYVDSGDYAVVVNDGIGCIKKIIKGTDAISLVDTNPEYDVEILSGQAVDRLKIYGKILDLYRKI